MSQNKKNSTVRRQNTRGPMNMNQAVIVDKPKNMRGTGKRMIGYSKGYVIAAVIAILAATLGTILQIIGPDKVKDMTNEISKGLPILAKGVMREGTINIDAVAKIGVLLVCLYVGAAVLTYIQGFIMATVTQRISKNMRTDIASKINRLPLKYFDKNSYGDVLSRITNDVDTIGLTLNQSIGVLVSDVTMFLGILIMMFYHSIILTLTSVSATVAGLVLMGIIMKKSQKHFAQQQESLGEVNGYIEEIYSGHNVVKVYNGGEEAKNRFSKMNGKLYSSAWKSQFLSGLMMPVMQFIGNFGYVAVCVVGAVLAINGKITFGVIIAFIMYIRMLTQPLTQVAQVANNLQRAVAAGERVFDFLDEEEQKDEREITHRLEKVEGRLEFKNVVFSYDKEIPVIRNFSAKIEPGEKVAIVGPTGAGKTTLVNLLMKFYDLDSGDIIIDSMPISQLTRANVNSLFGMVLQDTWTFQGSIMDNIKFSTGNASDEKVFEACKAVGLHHFIKTLPQGYETEIGNETSMSEGQKQLVTIARAMVENAPFLILDEATSSVDTRTERIVQAAMDKLTQGKTSFVIAHRLSTIKNADMILVMKEGNIVESGNHDQLMAQEGFYADLYNSQFEEA